MREMVSRMRRAFGGGSNTDELRLNEYACKGFRYLLFVDGLEFNNPVLGVDLDDDLLVLLERELAVKHHRGRNIDPGATPHRLLGHPDPANAFENHLATLSHNILLGISADM